MTLNSRNIFFAMFGIAIAALLVFFALYALGFVSEKGKYVIDRQYINEGFTFTGTLIDGKFSGNGKLVFENGDVYEGEFSAGRFEGHGIFTSVDDWRYEGAFNQGAITGDGTLFIKNEDTLMRDPSNSVVFLSSQGWKYIGGLSERGQDGSGKFRFRNGTVYEGDFFLGLAEGQGVYSNPDSLVYKGSFKGGKLDEKTSEVWKKGEKIR